MITRENVKKLLPIMKAYSEGKEIEFLNLGGKWTLLTDPNFDGEPFQYRIKNEPIYRPFKSVEECLNEMSKHQPFGWYKYNNNDYNLITHLDNNTDFEYRFKNYLFVDGTPFGIKEEE